MYHIYNLWDIFIYKKSSNQYKTSNVSVSAVSLWIGLHSTRGFLIIILKAVIAMGTNNGFKKEKEEKDKNTCSIPNEYI